MNDDLIVDGTPMDSFIPAIWTDSVMKHLSTPSSLQRLIDDMPRRRLTRRERLARWWDNRRPRVHLGACNHDDCDAW